MEALVMELIDIKATHKTPEIKGDMSAASFSIRGKSIPEDAREFFTPFKDWFIQTIESKPSRITAEIDLEYFNTSTSIILLDIFKKLNAIQDKTEIKVTWYYEEDDIEMEEVGQDYQFIIGDILELKGKARVD